MASDVIPYDAAAMYPWNVSKRTRVQSNGIVSQSRDGVALAESLVCFREVPVAPSARYGTATQS